MTGTVRLEELLAAATDGPWRASTLDSPYYVVQVPEHVGQPVIADQCDSHETARLIALAPDAVRLLIDMGEEMRSRTHPCKRDNGYRLSVKAYGTVIVQDGDPQALGVEACPTCSLLARLDRLGNTT